MESINEKRIAEVEKALGIKLYTCQREFILNGIIACRNERCTGRTTAYCIKLLLSEGEPIKLWDREQMLRLMDYKGNNSYVRFFEERLTKIYEQLKVSGVVTRTVEYEKGKDGEHRRYYSHYHGI